MIKFFTTYLFTFAITVIYSQADSIPQKRSLSYKEYNQLEGTFLIKLKRKPSFKLVGENGEFKKCSIIQLENEILQHTKKFPNGEVIITTTKRAKYKDIVEVLDFLKQSKVKKYALMDEF